MNYWDMTTVKIKYNIRVSVGVRGRDDIVEDITCTCRGHILPSDVSKYAIRKVCKKHRISDYMRMDSVAEIIDSDVVHK